MLHETEVEKEIVDHGGNGTGQDAPERGLMHQRERQPERRTLDSAAVDFRRRDERRGMARAS